MQFNSASTHKEREYLLALSLIDTAAQQEEVT
jgi:hypothetical protein